MTNLAAQTSHKVRVLTATDLHQLRALYDQLAMAVAQHKPDVVALVGDVLECFKLGLTKHLMVEECSERLAALPVEHLVFTRGNHELQNWTSFVNAWPHSFRPLVGLYGSSYQVGPLTMLGFPCHVGSEAHWRSHLEAGSNIVKPYVTQPREALQYEFEEWLPPLLQQTGAAGRALWLMHEPPLSRPLATVDFNSQWQEAVERYQPFVVVSGHNHITPIRSARWHERLGESLCINAGQTEETLHYCVLDFEFRDAQAKIPSRVAIQMYPWDRQVVCP